MGEPRDPQDRLAEAISDRAAVDWAFEYGALPHLRTFLDRLREIDRVATALTSAPEGIASPSTPGGGTPGSGREPMPATVGHYVVEGVLGRGGMGIVYLARDPRLDRAVAIKAMPVELRDDPDGLRRFEREARLLASLDHPHIATVYGLETDRGIPYLVMERVEGESLAARLRRQPLALDEALRVCAQVAAALEAAHERGVIHRDLKPGNVMVGPRGAKVLDFGLAKRFAEPPDDAPAGPASLVTDSMVRLGTPGYMSPEQVLGAPQDARTDLFAFGCLLYESVTGRRAFSGDSAAQLLAVALDAGPDWQTLPTRTPRDVRVLLKRCLQKEAARRGTMTEARQSLEAALSRIDRMRAEAPDGAPDSRPHALPRESNRFIGREREIDECLALLESERLLTLIGIGGAGKTRLALRVAYEALVDRPEGVWFVDLSAIADEGRVASAIAEAVGVREEPGVPLLRTVSEALSRGAALLVLDNCEHVTSGCVDAVRGLLELTPVHILATSRDALGIPDERRYPVPTLSVPPVDSTEPAELMRYEAVELFVERARRTDPDLALNARTGPAIADLCRRLDGLPLALELAAARVRVLSVGEIAARLDERFRLLASSAGGLPPRHRRLRDVIAWSYEHLEEAHQRMLRALSVFAGGASLEAAAAVFAAGKSDEFEAVDALTELTERALVRVDRSAETTRYGVLEAVREYALERLSDSGETSGMRDRHLDWHLAFVESAFPHLSGPSESEWVARLARETPNILAAHHWCDHATGGAEKGLRLTQLLGRFWYVRGDVTLGGREVARALERPGAEEPTSARAGALYTAGDLAVFRGEFELAGRYFDEGLAIHRRLGDPNGVFRNLLGLGNAATESGDHGRARAHFEECLALARALGYRRGEAVVLGNLGEVASRQGDLVAASDYNEASLEILRDESDVHARAMIGVNQASVLIRLGSLASARARLLEGLQRFRTLGAKRGAFYSMQAAATLAAELGDWQRTARFLGVAETLRTATGLSLSDTDRAECESMMARARQGLGGAAVDAASAAGRSSTFEPAIDETLAWLAEPPAATEAPNT